jgi:flagellar assembly factor FliW
MSEAMTATNKTSVRIETSRFGTIEAEEEIIITFTEGLPSFEQCRRFVILTLDDDNPIRWLQSLDDGRLAFPIIDPWLFQPDYAPTISDLDAEKLQIDEESPKLLYAIVTIPRDNPQAMTANLLGPILINPLTRQGRQVIVTNDQYHTRHRVVRCVAQAA